MKKVSCHKDEIMQGTCPGSLPLFLPKYTQTSHKWPPKMWSFSGCLLFTINFLFCSFKEMVASHPIHLPSPPPPPCLPPTFSKSPLEVHRSDYDHIFKLTGSVSPRISLQVLTTPRPSQTWKSKINNHKSQQTGSEHKNLKGKPLLTFLNEIQNTILDTLRNISHDQLLTNMQMYFKKKNWFRLCEYPSIFSVL